MSKSAGSFSVYEPSSSLYTFLPRGSDWKWRSNRNDNRRFCVGGVSTSKSVRFRYGSVGGVNVGIR